jgi:hypothetical protein
MKTAIKIPNWTRDTLANPCKLSPATEPETSVVNVLVTKDVGRAELDKGEVTVEWVNNSGNSELQMSNASERIRAYVILTVAKHALQAEAEATKVGQKHVSFAVPQTAEICWVKAHGLKHGGGVGAAVPSAGKFERQMEISFVRILAAVALNGCVQE